MLKISDIRISARCEITKALLYEKAKKILRCGHINSLSIARKSVDARDKSNVFYVVSLLVDVDNEERFLKIKNVSPVKNNAYIPPYRSDLSSRPVVIGFGPAGMFCALVLARAGARPIVFERGSAVEKRQTAVKNFWQNGTLDTSTNVQFGEGGAGTFSDGKLTTGIKDKRCRYVLSQLVHFGAPDEILYEAKPHIGTDRLVDIVRSVRNEIISLGGDIRFDSRVEDIVIEKGRVRAVVCEGREYPADSVVLAIGHSARDTFEMLYKKGVDMCRKPFAMGVRIEHPQEIINTAQYGEFAKYLPPADYKLAAHLKNGRSAYTFCMCPGGVVTASASEEMSVVTNGMSYYSRNGKNANSALLIGINTDDFGSEYALSGVELQRRLERRAFEAGGGNYNAPVQRVGDFMRYPENRSSFMPEAWQSFAPSYKPGVKFTELRDIFPDFMNESLELAIYEMDKKIEGFGDKNAIMTAVESRSSSPVRITRGESFASVNTEGLYPCGEGCGYAGGIMSAAVDGVKCAEAVLGVI